MKNVLLLLFVCAMTVSEAQPIITFQKVIPAGLSKPVDVVNAKDGSNRLFIVEQTGTVRIRTGDSLLSSPFLDVTNLISTNGSERGLLSLAFHPNYATNRYFFIYFTDLSGYITVRRYQTKPLDANHADTATGVTLFTIPKRFANHNGGKLMFGPDGYLYFGTGDGGYGGDPDNNAQNPASLLGKLIRVDVNGFSNTAPYYTIPPTNPFINNPAFSPEIFAIGLRNPWRYSFDRQTGNLWLADVGQDTWEEVNAVPVGLLAGANFGWSCVEATHAYKADCNAQPGINSGIVPVFEYPHNNSTGGYAVTGGFVYRGLEFPDLQGYYLCVDFVVGNGWLIKPNPSTNYTTTRQSWESNISAFGEGEDSTLYATGLGGILYKVVASSALPLHVTSFAGAVVNNYHLLTWKVTNEEAGDTYIVERKFASSETFTEAYRTKAGSNRDSNHYTVQLTNPSSITETFYRLKTVLKNGQVQYSSIIRLATANANNFRVFISGKTLYANVPASATNICLYNTEGKLLLKQSTAGGNGFSGIPLQNLPHGLIIVKIQMRNEVLVKKVVY